jgi:hypothetical protein
MRCKNLVSKFAFHKFNMYRYISGCSAALPASSRVCIVAGYVEACEWLSAAAPTDGDMWILAAVPDAPLDAAAAADEDAAGGGVEGEGVGGIGGLGGGVGGCEGLNPADVRATLRLGSMVLRWAAASDHRRMVALATPWMLLTDRWFGAGNYPNHVIQYPNNVINHPNHFLTTQNSLLTGGGGTTAATAGATAAAAAAAAGAASGEKHLLLQSNVTRLVFRLNSHDEGTDRYRTVSPATSWWGCTS